VAEVSRPSSRRGSAILRRPLPPEPERLPRLVKGGPLSRPSLHDIRGLQPPRTSQETPAASLSLGLPRPPHHTERHRLHRVRRAAPSTSRPGNRRRLGRRMSACTWSSPSSMSPTVFSPPAYPQQRVRILPRASVTAVARPRRPRGRPGRPEVTAGPRQAHTPVKKKKKKKKKKKIAVRVHVTLRCCVKTIPGKSIAAAPVPPRLGRGRSRVAQPVRAAARPRPRTPGAPRGMWYTARRKTKPSDAVSRGR